MLTYCGNKMLVFHFPFYISTVNQTWCHSHCCGFLSCFLFHMHIESKKTLPWMKTYWCVILCLIFSFNLLKKWAIKGSNGLLCHCGVSLTGHHCHKQLVKHFCNVLTMHKGHMRIKKRVNSNSRKVNLSLCLCEWDKIELKEKYFINPWFQTKTLNCVSQGCIRYY